MSIKAERAMAEALATAKKKDAEIASLKKQVAQLAADNAKLAAELKNAKKARSVSISTLADE